MARIPTLLFLLALSGTVGGLRDGLGPTRRFGFRLSLFFILAPGLVSDIALAAGAVSRVLSGVSSLLFGFCPTCVLTLLVALLCAPTAAGGLLVVLFVPSSLIVDIVDVGGLGVVRNLRLLEDVLAGITRCFPR